MQLQFEHTQSLGPGTQPQAIHTPENIVQVLFTRPDSQGRIYAMDASTPMGQWADREFNPAYLVCTDVDVQFMKLKYVSAHSIYVVWKNDTEEGETGTVRHRLAVWAMRQDLSAFLRSGTIELREDDPVAKVRLTLENPGQIISSELDTILTPGAAILLFFRAGDSARYPMGRYFSDRNAMGVTADTTTVEGRGAIGKLLKDQTFDEDNSFPRKNLAETMSDILQSFGVQNYWVGTTTMERGMEFPPDMDGLTGIQELLKTATTWRIKEDLSGAIGIAHRNDSRFTQPSTYTFQRGSEVFTRDIVREDQDAYARVCVYTDDFAIKVYRDVDFRFTMAKKRTMYVRVADNTTLADAQEYADTLADMLGEVGVIETFVGPFRPHIIPGDRARIQGPGSRILGTITTVMHQFGKDGSGFATQFTVDSGGRVGKVRISDYIEKIAGRQTSTGGVKRLY